MARAVGEHLLARARRSRAVRDSFPKLDPRLQLKNPVMFIVELGSVITTGIFVLDLARGHTGSLWFVGVIAIWLWLTVLFANFAEAIAEGRGKAQANALRATRTTTIATLPRRRVETCPRPSCSAATSSSSTPARSSRPTARSSRASARSTSRRSPASRRR